MQYLEVWSADRPCACACVCVVWYLCSDWKLAKWGMFEGIEGNDVAGHVEAVGSGVTEFKKGDKVRVRGSRA